MRQHIVPQLATLFDGPRAHVVSAEPVSRRLAASADSNTGLHIHFSPVCWAASGKGREASTDVSRVWSGSRGAWIACAHAQEYVHACSTPPIDGLGHATHSAAVKVS